MEFQNNPYLPNYFKPTDIRKHTKDNGKEKIYSRESQLSSVIYLFFFHLLGVASNGTDDYPNSWSRVPFWPPTQQYETKPVNS